MTPDLAPLLLALAPAGTRVEPVSLGGGSYGIFLLETVVVLALVCVLAWAVIRFGLRRLYAIPGDAATRGAPLRVIARLPLEPRRTIYLIEACGKSLLVGVSDGGAMTTLAELDAAAVATATAAATTQAPPRRFIDLLTRKRDDKPRV